MSTPKKILCPHCRLSLPHDEHAVNSAVECSHCGDRFIMPQLESAQSKKDAPRPQRSPFWFSNLPDTGSAAESPAATEPPAPPSPRPLAVPPIPKVELVEQQQTSHGDDFEEEDGHADAIGPLDQDSGLVEYEERPHWRAVMSGLGLILFGILLSMASSFVAVITTGSMMNQFGFRYSSWDSSYSPDWAPAMFCLSGGCSAISLLLVVVGQSMCCSAPNTRCRTPAVVSLLFLIFGSFIGLFLTLFAAATSSPYRSRFWDPSFLYVMFGLAAILVFISHVIFIHFVREVGKYFRSKATLRQAGYYQVFVFLYMAGTVFALLVRWVTAPLPYSSTYSSNRPLEDFSAIMGVCWGCFGLFIMIAFLTLLTHTRSLIKDRLKSPVPPVFIDE